MKNSRRFSRYGIATKGVVFFLMGSLAALTASKFTDQIKGGREILEWISKLSLGWFMLLAITIGIAAYIFSRVYLSINNKDYDGTSGKPKIRRFGYVINALGYCILLFSCIRLLLGTGYNVGDSTFMDALFSSDWGKIAVLAVAIGLGVSAINEWYMSLSNMMYNFINEDLLSPRRYKYLLILGRVGRFSRGIVFGVFSYLFFKSLVGWSKNVPRGTDAAFTFMNATYGSWIMGVIAVGLALYGLFLILSARHRNVPI